MQHRRWRGRRVPTSNPVQWRLQGRWLVGEDDKLASDSMDFVFSLKSFLEEFKSMNYYCLFALWSFQRQIWFLGMASNIFDFSCWCWLRSEEELNRRGPALAMGSAKARAHLPLRAVITLWVLSQMTLSTAEKTGDPISKGVLRMIRPSAWRTRWLLSNM